MRTALLWLLLTLPAAAQQAEQITVTGSAANPTGTTQLSAGTLDRSGTASVGALLDQIPAFGSQGVNAAQTDGGFGEYFVDLRNLNFDRTLVLVDGNRFVLSGIQTDEAVDLNTIPAAFVDHIEVLKDGTQPAYGPDAVAGAVNLVLADQMEGFKLTTYGAATTAADGGVVDGNGGDGSGGEISLLGGHGFANGHIAAGLDFYQRAPVLQSDRAWAANPIASATTGDILYGSPATPGGHAVGSDLNDIARGNGIFTPYNAATDYYNPAGDRDLQGGLQRESAYFDGDLTLSDAVSANAELLFTNRRATTLQPPQTLGLNGTAKHPDGFTIPATDPYNPFGETVTLERVVSEAGAQTTTTSGPVWRALAGLDGTRGDWTWTLSFDHGQSLSRYVTDNEINLTRALQTAGNGPCEADEGCVQANWFGPNSLSAQAVRYITYTARSQSAYSETVGLARAEGPVFTLPGGSALLTLGADERFEHAATTVPPVTASGDQAGNDAKPTSGGYSSTEAFTSLRLPLLKDLWAAEKLDFLAQARLTATSRYGSFPSLRAVVTYKPVRGIELGVVSGTARRPPALSEAFLGITGSQQPVTDPCAASSGLRGNRLVNENCLAQGFASNFSQTSPLVDVESGGNANLKPEQAENEMLGLTLSPPALPFATAGVDYYQYRITRAIDSLADTDPNLIPDICYESAHLSSPACSLITRIAGGGNAGQLSSILALDENVGTIKENGIDFDVSVKALETKAGALHLDWQTNWLLNYRLHTDGVPGFTQYAGTFPGLNEVGSYARIRSRLAADWTWGKWSAGWTGRFISGARVLGATPGDLFSKAPGVLYQDIDISRQFGKLTAMAGVDNLADVRPPTLVDGETNTNTSTYDVAGRLVWGRLVYMF